MFFNILSQGKGICHQYIASIAASFGFALVGSSIAWPSPTLTKMNKGETPIMLDIDNISWMVSLMFLGHMISPIPCGYLMDRIGKKNTSIVLSFLPFVSWILIYYGESVTYLYIARTFAGMWNGIVSTVVPLYIGEIAEPDIRGSLNTLNNAFINVGVLFTFIIGPYVSYHALAIICGSSVVFYFIFYMCIPESPYFYLMCNKREKALKSLKWFRDDNVNIEHELQSIEKSLALQTVEKGTVKEIFLHRGNRKAFIIAAMYSIFKKLAGSRVIQAYGSTTLPSTTFGFLSPDECVIILGITSLTLSFFAVYVTAKFSRRWLLNVSSFGTGTIMYILAGWFLIRSHIEVDTSNYDSLIFVCFLIFNIIFSVGIGAVGTCIKGEMYSANVKSLSSSITTVLVAISAFIINKFYLIIASYIGMYFNYFIYGTSCFLSILFTIYYVPDLQGKTLQEIQDILNSPGKNKEKVKFDLA